MSLMTIDHCSIGDGPIKMSMTNEIGIPLYEELENGWHKILSAPDATRRESSDLRRARQSAFEKFRELGFPSIRNEDWKYTNITRFLKDEFALDGLLAGDKITVSAPAELLKKAVIPGLDCYQVVLVNGVWDGKISGGELPKGIKLYPVAEALKNPDVSGVF